jgi:hypothetical protein
VSVFRVGLRITLEGDHVLGELVPCGCVGIETSRDAVDHVCWSKLQDEDDYVDCIRVKIEKVAFVVEVASTYCLTRCVMIDSAAGLVPRKHEVPVHEVHEAGRMC